jgi:hypothetical protein
MTAGAKDWRDIYEFDTPVVGDTCIVPELSADSCRSISLGRMVGWRSRR